MAKSGSARVGTMAAVGPKVPTDRRPVNASRYTYPATSRSPKRQRARLSPLPQRASRTMWSKSPSVASPSARFAM
jgi:hypothetical protein